MKRVYSVFQVKGLNLDRLLNNLKKKGITLLNINKIDNKTINLTVYHNQSKKFFAICKELCYNVKEIKEKGLFYPLLFLKRNLGVLMGAVILLSFSLYFNNRLLDIRYSGSGSVLKNEVQVILSENGIDKFSKFSNFNLNDISNKILSSNPRLSYVNCKKDGNVLSVELALGERAKDKLTGNAKSLISNFDGVITDLKVYRGTALIKKGESVKKGDIIVCGDVVIKDQPTRVNVLAVATILTQDKIIYKSQKDGEEDFAIIYAEQGFERETEIIESSVDKKQMGGTFVYTVTIKRKVTQFVG